MNDRSGRLELRVGVVALVAIVILILGALWGRGVTDTFDQQEVEIHFPDAGGITTGTPVFLNGVEVGSVSNVSARQDYAEATAHIESGIRLADDAEAVIRVKELTGGKKVELDPGSSGNPLEGGAIPGRNEGDIGELIAVAGNLSGQIEPIIRRVDSVLADLSAIIGDPRVRNGIRETVTEFSQAGRRANRLLASSGPKLANTLTTLEDLSSDLSVLVETNGPAIERILGSTERAASDAESAIADGRRLLDRLDRLAGDLEAIFTNVREGKGLISTLLYDESMSEELRRTIIALRTFLARIDQKGVNVNVKLGHE